LLQSFSAWVGKKHHKVKKKIDCYIQKKYTDRSLIFPKGDEYVDKRYSSPFVMKEKIKYNSLLHLQLHRYNYFFELVVPIDLFEKFYLVNVTN